MYVIFTINVFAVLIYIANKSSFLFLFINQKLLFYVSPPFCYNLIFFYFASSFSLMKSEKFLNVKQISPKFPMGIGWAGQKIHSITELLSHLIWNLF